MIKKLIEGILGKLSNSNSKSSANANANAEAKAGSKSGKSEAKAEADAKAYELSAVMKALEGIDPNVIQSLASIGMQPNKLIAIAFQELAEKAGQIGQLNISPDLLQELMKESK
jgi:hypothetical protein